MSLEMGVLSKSVLGKGKSDVLSANAIKYFDSNHVQQRDGNVSNDHTSKTRHFPEFFFHSDKESLSGLSRRSETVFFLLILNLHISASIIRLS